MLRNSRHKCACERRINGHKRKKFLKEALYWRSKFQSLLTPRQIRERVLKYNQTGNFDVFADVSDLQQVDVLYPHIPSFNKLNHQLYLDTGKFEFTDDESDVIISHENHPDHHRSPL